MVVGEQFDHDQIKSDNSEGDLHSFSPEAPDGERLLPPLRRRPFAERSNSPDHVQVDAGTKNSKCHHGNAYAVLVKACCWRLCSSDNSGEGSESDDHPNSTNRHEEGANALQDDERKAR